MAKAATKRSAKAKVLSDGTLMLHGVIGDEYDGLSGAQVVEDITSIDTDPISVNINSPGGFVADGLGIYNALLNHKSKVVVDITGVAASMASVIAMAGDTVRIARNGMVMIHDPWVSAAGNSDDLRKAADMLDKFGTSLVGIYMNKTGLAESEVREMMKEETWLDADEALDKGFVDEIAEPTEAEAFADLDISELGTVPAALTALIREGRQMARTKNPSGTGTGDEPKGTSTEPGKEPETEPKVATDPVAAAREGVRQEMAAERKRVQDIENVAKRLGLPPAFVTTHVAAGTPTDQVNLKAIEARAELDESSPHSWRPSGVGVGTDERDTFLNGAAAWLIMKAGRARTVEAFTKKTLDPGEFRGMSLMDLARETLHRAGVPTRGMGKMEIAGSALTRGPLSAHGVNTTSDFPVLLENVLHKMLLAAYGTTPDTWRKFCAEGSVSDFRPHPRLRLGSFSSLDALLESGEFKQKHFPDAEKETITAATKGNIVGLTRQAIVNDDVDGFSRLIARLGRAAGLSVEVDVYALLALNAGLGPVMGDGDTLFHANHSNVGAGTALSVAGLDADRVLMASQQDPAENEYLDLRPQVLVLSVGLGGAARVLNAAEYDIDPIDTGTDESNKFMMPNRVRGLFSEIVDTPRIVGTRRYLFADPEAAPVIEVAFLDGQSVPQLDVEEGFEYDGIRWRVRYDYAVGATDYRGATTDAGQ